MKEINAFIGVHGSGKTTLINELEKKHGKDVVYVNGDAADIWKEKLNLIDGISRQRAFLSTYEGCYTVSVGHTKLGKTVLTDIHGIGFLVYGDWWIEDKNKEKFHELYLERQHMINDIVGDIPVNLIYLRVEPESIDELIHRLKTRETGRGKDFVEGECKRDYIQAIINGYEQICGRVSDILVLNAMNPVQDNITKLEELMGLSH